MRRTEREIKEKNATANDDDDIADLFDFNFSVWKNSIEIAVEFKGKMRILRTLCVVALMRTNDEQCTEWIKRRFRCRPSVTTSRVSCRDQRYQKWFIFGARNLIKRFFLFVTFEFGRIVAVELIRWILEVQLRRMGLNSIFAGMHLHSASICMHRVSVCRSGRENRGNSMFTTYSKCTECDTIFSHLLSYFFKQLVKFGRKTIPNTKWQLFAQQL